MYLVKTNFGPYLTVAREGTFIMLRQLEGGAPLDTAMGQILWNALSQSDPLSRVLAVLASQGIEKTPSFAIVQMRPEETKVVVRAQATVHTLDNAGRREDITGRGASTWAEATLPPTHEFAITMTGTVPKQVPDLQDSCLVASAVVTASDLFTLGWVAPTQQERSDTPVTPALPKPSSPDQSAVEQPLSHQPLSHQHSIDSPDESTILSNNLVQYRAQMETGRGQLPPPTDLHPTLVLSTGLRLAIDRPILIGRAPQASRISANELPRLVTVPSPGNDISRTHVQVKWEDDLVLVTDLQSTNGVMLTEPHHSARRLHPDEPTPVPPHAVVDLGDGISFTIEAAQ